MRSLRLVDSKFQRHPDGARAVVFFFADQSNAVVERIALRWIERADAGQTQQTMTRGISGTTKKGDTVYEEDTRYRIQGKVWRDPKAVNAFQLYTEEEAFLSQSFELLRGLALPWEEGVAGGAKVLGYVKGIRGQVHWRTDTIGRGVDDASVPLQPGDPIVHGDTVATDANLAAGRPATQPTDNAVTLAMVDGSGVIDVSIGPRSRATVLQAEHGAVLKLQEGWAWARTAKAWPEGSLLSVWGEGWVSSFRNADLIANADEPTFTVYLDSGTLLQSPPDLGRTLTMEHGRQTTAGPSGAARPLSLDHALYNTRVQSMIVQSAAAPFVVGRMTGGEGYVVGVRRDGVDYALPKDVRLHIGDTICTDTRSWARFDITAESDEFNGPDVASVAIGAESSMTIERPEILVLENGECRVSHPTGVGGKTLREMRVGPLLITIIGTDFVARYDALHARGQVMLDKGAVSVRLGAGAPVTLAPGQRIDFTPAAVAPLVAMAPGEYEKVSTSLTSTAAVTQVTHVDNNVDPFAPVPPPRPVAPDPVAPSPPGPAPSRPEDDALSRVNWTRHNADGVFTLDAPADWVRVQQKTDKALWVYDPKDPMVSASVIVMEAPADFTLKALVDGMMESTRKAFPDAEFEQRPAVVAGVPAAFVALRATLAQAQSKSVVVNYSLVANGRAYIVQAQTPFASMEQHKELMGRLISSFAFVKPRGQRE
ncbi:MAG: hypothetical protein GC159_04970 [Phycisphaera sp.]|nr:hypothetical protein [Phycisphaera sp.]